MSTNQPASITARVRDERLRLGWTQADTGGRAGMSERSYQRFEQFGQITLDRLLAVATALGLELNLAAAAGMPAIPSACPVRQRGLRHSRPPTPETSTPTKPSPAEPSAPMSRPGKSQAPPPRVLVDGAAVAQAAREYRDAIRYLVGAIVTNRLNNYTSATVVQTTMSARHVPDDQKPAFVAATESELGKLTPENCTAMGIDAPHLAAWSETWRPDLGIVGAVE
jgi:hypothetical protein